ncbi:MAG: hypothetical protein JZU55_10960 [Afipia sp.]|nr:hypothetical protein [Afipia sp.]
MTGTSEKSNGLILSRSPLMMRIYSAARAEEVLRPSGMEAVGCQHVLALQEVDPTHFRHDDDRASHPAVRAGAAPDRVEAVAERHLETHCAAMALARGHVRVAQHVACASCSGDFYLWKCGCGIQKSAN